MSQTRLSRRLRLAMAILAGFLALCGIRAGSSEAKKESTSMTMTLTSPAFSSGQPIPTKYTCDGADVSPPLQWRDVPERARSLALICNDPDAPAGTWVHWVLYDLPPTTKELAEKIAPVDTVSGGARQGVNDFKKSGYGGPCPPPGKPHRYFFKLYALDAPTGLKPRATKADVERAMKGHILAEGELMGTYQRSK